MNLHFGNNIILANVVGIIFLFQAPVLIVLSGSNVWILVITNSLDHVPGCNMLVMLFY